MKQSTSSTAGNVLPASKFTAVRSEPASSLKGDSRQNMVSSGPSAHSHTRHYTEQRGRRTSESFFPNPADRGACARFRLRKKAAKQHEVPHAVCGCIEEIILLRKDLIRVTEQVNSLRSSCARQAGLISEHLVQCGQFMTAVPQLFPISRQSPPQNVPSSFTPSAFPVPEAMACPVPETVAAAADTPGVPTSPQPSQEPTQFSSSTPLVSPLGSCPPPPPATESTFAPLPSKPQRVFRPSDIAPTLPKLRGYFNRPK